MLGARLVRSSSMLSLALTVLGGNLLSQDTSKVAGRDSIHEGRLHGAASRVARAGRWSLGAARRGVEIVFDVDSTVERWSLHPDRASATMRAVSPVAFWVPVVAVAAEPAIWADEAQDGHIANARYARTTTIGLGLGFIVSRTVKHFVHRTRPCAGPEANGRIRGADTGSSCPRGLGARASFFSEHTMALFTIASAASFQAQRQQAPNAEQLTAITFAAAGVFATGRVYQHHHWLSDVLVGAAVGTASGFLAAQLTPAVPRAR